MPGFSPDMPEYSSPGRQTVGRKLHDKGCRLTFQHRLAEEYRGNHREDDARQVNGHHDVVRVPREECSREEYVDGQLCAAAHEGDGEDGRDAVPGAF